MRRLLTAIWTAMKDPLQGLVLLGLLCQGASADISPLPVAGWAMLFVYPALALVCIIWRRPHRLFNQSTELIVVAAAILFATWESAQLGLAPNRLVAVGHGLVVYQLLHLVRPLTLREQMWTAGVAVVHLVIGSQVLVDYRFIIALGLAVLLVPRTLFHLEAARYRTYVTAAARGPGWQEFTLLVVIMAAVFLLLPRFNISPAIAATGASAPAAASAAGPLSEELDTVGGGPTNELSNQLICRVEGERLGYLKVFALDTFDGRVWSQSSYAQQRKREELRGPHVVRTQALRRIVTVISPSALRTNLPADGAVQEIALSGQLPIIYLSDCGSLTLPTTLRRQVTYTYWTVPNDPGEQLSARYDLGRYTRLPPMSTELQQWLAERVGNQTDKYQQAQTLTAYLRNNFTYKLGAPELNRMSPIDDFLLHQKEGHCERFASALAVLLRMEGIPARVGLGYVPTERNQLGQFYNIRVSHGHAWTEAWFPNRGWIVLDGTPVGRETPPIVSSAWLPALRDWAEYTWYAHVVEFTANDQQSLVNAAVTRMSTLGQLAWDNLLGLLAAVLVLAVSPALLGAVRRWQGAPRIAPARAVQLRRARSFYYRLQTLLARDHLERRQQQTPLEFLRLVEAAGHPRAPEITLITQTFCQVRYGELELTPDLQERMAAALALVARTRHRRTGTITAPGR